MEKTTHFCFLALSLVRFANEQDEMKKIAQDIMNYIRKNYSNKVNIDFIDYKDGKYNAELNYFQYRHPFIKDFPFDKDCILEALEIIKEIESYQQKTRAKKGKLKSVYLASVYALLIYGWLGTGAEMIEQKEFREWIMQFNPDKSTFSKHLNDLRGRTDFPNWDNDIDIASSIIKFQEDFLNIYWTKMAEKHPLFYIQIGTKTE